MGSKNAAIEETNRAMANGETEEKSAAKKMDRNREPRKFKKKKLP